MQSLCREFGLPEGDALATIEALVNLVWTHPVYRWRHRWQAIEHLGQSFSRSGAYAKWGAELLERISHRDPTRLPQGQDETSVFAVLRILDFDPIAPRAWTETVFSRVALPWMRQAIQAGRYGVALMLEQHGYGAYVIREETEERFRRSFQLWSEDMRVAGARAGASLGPVAIPHDVDPPGVAFYLHSGSVLAHTRLMLDFLEAHAAFDKPLIRPSVLLRGRPSPELELRLRNAGVPCIELEPVRNDGQARCFEAYVEMRNVIEQDRIAAVVWVSVAVHMAFAFALRVAPVQIWWALKYHSLKLPEIDGYITSGSVGSTKLVGGRPWRSSPLAGGDWYRPDLAPAAADVRARYRQHDVLFACLGRAEKINSLPFLEAVAAILRRCPRAGFLWTGRERSQEIVARLEALGVADRCHFIGWVDTKLYAQVMDVFLDSFPFPCGFTLYEAMAAGKPVVMYSSPESLETGLVGMLEPLLGGATGTDQERARARSLFGDSLAFCANDASAYAELAVSLAGDPALRHESGAANRRFVAEFLSDRGAMARTLATHLLEIIGEAQGR